MTLRLFLVRHGATEWSELGKHTGRTDLPLTAMGERQAQALAPALAKQTFARVIASPLQRAFRTAELAGFAGRVERNELLLEMNYGDDEGRTRKEIRLERPRWDVFTEGPKNGETLAEVAARAKQLFASLAGTSGDVALFAHGHVLRILAATWLEQPPTLGAQLDLGPASISILGHLHETPAIERWNDRSHCA